MYYRFVNLEETMDTMLKQQNCLPKLLVLGKSLYQVDLIEKLSPQILQVGSEPAELQHERYTFIYFQADLDIFIWICPKHAFIQLKQKQDYYSILKQIFTDNALEDITVQIVNQKYINQLGRIYDEFINIRDITYLLNSYTQAVDALKKSVLTADEHKYRQIITRPALMAFVSDVIAQLDQYAVSDPEVFHYLQILETDHLPVHPPDRLLMLGPIINELVEIVNHVVNQVVADVQKKEFYIRNKYRTELTEKQKQLLIKKIKLLELLSKTYPELEEELKKLKEQLKNLENPNCPLKEFFSQLKKHFGDLIDLKDIVRIFHSDVMPEGLKSYGDELVRFLNVFKKQGNKAAIEALKKIIDGYKRPERDSIVEKTTLNALLNISNFFSSTTELFAVDKSLLMMSADELNEQIQKEIQKLDKEIKDIEDQILILKQTT